MSEIAVRRRGPKPQPEERRSSSFCRTRLTPREKLQLQVYCERNAVTISETLRDAVLNLFSDEDDRR